jgi:ribosomal protein L35
MKTNKSFTKRLRVTRKGKILARTAGNNHFNAKRSSNERRHKSRGHQIDMSNVLRSRFLPNTPNV